MSQMKTPNHHLRCQGDPTLTFTENHTVTSNSLIEAIEAGDLDLVCGILASGADPNARKTVTITCTVWQSIKHGSWGRADVGMGNFESRVDSRQCESALALAIHSKNLAIVQALIRYGADMHAPIEWALPGFYEIWDEKAWFRRWRFVYSFPDALSLAAGVKNTVAARGGPSLVGNSPEFPSVRVNCKGGNVSLVNPSKDLSIYSGQCGPDMAAALTAAGANPTLPVINSLLEIAFGRNNKDIYDTAWLAPLLLRPRTIAPATVDGLSSTVEQLQRTVARLQSELDDLRASQALVLEALNTARATEADLRQEVVGLRRRMGDGGEGGAV